MTALWRGQLIEAIKLVRMERNLGLKEARDLVSAYVQTQPALRSRIAQTQADAREGLLRWLIFLLAGAVGLTYLLL
jgi:ribosomal protein L7/L12